MAYCIFIMHTLIGYRMQMIFTEMLDFCQKVLAVVSQWYCVCFNYGAHFVDLCARHTPCLNGGTCTSVGSDSGYTCTCATGYTGRNCTVHIDYCASNMCLNGGTCTSVGSDSGYTCTCATGYTGRNCSVHIDDCANNPCQNGGTCTVSCKTLHVY